MVEKGKRLKKATKTVESAVDLVLTKERKDSKKLLLYFNILPQIIEHFSVDLSLRSGRLCNRSVDSATEKLYHF